MNSLCENCECNSEIEVCADCDWRTKRYQIPKFATNGDVFCALWDVSVVYEKGCYRIIRGGERWSSILKFSEEWWNAPYRKE